jgi:hypothetical protein
MATTPKSRSAAPGARNAPPPFPVKAAAKLPATSASPAATARKSAAAKALPAARKTVEALAPTLKRPALKTPAKPAPAAVSPAAAGRKLAAKKVAAVARVDVPTPAKAPAKKTLATPLLAKKAVAGKPPAKKTIAVVASPVVARKAAAKKAAVAPVAAKKTAVAPVAAKKAAVAPVAAKKAAVAPVAAKKAAVAPVAAKKAAVAPVAAKKAAVVPVAAKKAAVAPVAAKKAAVVPVAAKKAAVAPVAAKKAAVAPVAAKKAAVAPVAAKKPISALAAAKAAPVSRPSASNLSPGAPVQPLDVASADVVAAPVLSPATTTERPAPLPAPVASPPPEPSAAAGRRRQRSPRPAELAPTPPAPSFSVSVSAELAAAPARVEAVAVLPPSGPAHSEILLVGTDQRRLVWVPGHQCPASLQQAAQQRLDAQQHLAPDDDAALPTLLRLATEAGHLLRVDEAVWPHLAAHRDARTRLATLEAAYPQGPASMALRELLRSPLPAYQAEGALFAVVAGRALIADERGLGKGVQAIAAAALWRRHFGVSRVLVLCAPSQRAAWQRAWQRFDGATAAEAQVMDGGLHQRQALWSTDAAVRILSPDALASDAAHLADWAPELIVVDEPQQLDLRAADWAALQSPHALVLCGSPLAEQPVLMSAIVNWLDEQRLGPLAALHELQVAGEQSLSLSDDDVERLTASLSRLMLQRLRDDLHEQLPALVHSERLLALAPGQREAHDRQLAVLRRLLAGWQRSGYLSDADQWRMALALRAAQWACHRADPVDPASALADASVQAVAAQLAQWQACGPLKVAVLCASAADREQLAARLDAPAGVHLLLPSDGLPAGLDAVLQTGVPWRTRRSPAGPRGQAAPGQQWLYLVAQDSLEAGLFDSLAQRLDAPRGLADGTGRAYLQGERLVEWLSAIAAAVDAASARLPDEARHA